MSEDEKKRNLDHYTDAQADDLLAQVATRARAGGFSLRPFAELAEPTGGTMVALPNSAGLNLTLDLRGLTADMLRAELRPWLKRALAFLVDHGDTYLGGWYDAAGGKLYFDVSERYEDHGLAKRLGLERNQRTVYRIEEDRLYFTGGTGT